MAKLQRDTVPYEHEQVIRNFLGMSEFVGFYIPPSIKRHLLGLLGYKTAPNGALIWANIEVKYRLGQNNSMDWVDTFTSDWEELCNDRDEPRTVADLGCTPNTSSGESTEGN